MDKKPIIIVVSVIAIVVALYFVFTTGKKMMGPGEAPPIATGGMPGGPGPAGGPPGAPGGLKVTLPPGSMPQQGGPVTGTGMAPGGAR